MTKISSIVCTTDLTPSSNQSIPMAATLARALGAKLKVAHIMDYPFEAKHSYITDPVGKFEAEALAHARPMIEELLKGSEIKDWELDIRTGETVREIQYLVEKESVDLLVAATHKREGLEHLLLLGSVTRKLLHNIKIPMLIAPGDGRRPASPTWSPARIVVATDFSDNARSAVDLAFEFAEVFKSEVKLITVMEPSEMTRVPGLQSFVDKSLLDQHFDQEAKDLKAQIEELAASKKYDRLETAVLSGPADEEICHYAACHQADLVFMGLQGRGIIGNFLIGSTADRVIRSGRVPVMAVPR